METRTPGLRTILLPAGFVLAIAVIAVAIFQSFGGALPLSPHDYRIDVPLKRASGLVRGSDVKIAGVDVGRVVEVHRTGGAALATIEIDPAYAPLRSAATAIPRLKSLLGEGYLEIAPGPRGAAILPEGTRMSGRQVRTSVELDEFLSTFDQTTRRRLRDLIGGFERALADRGVALNDTLGAAAPATEDLRTIFVTLRRQRGDLRRVVSGSAGVLRALGDNEGALKGAVRAGNSVLDVTATRDRELAATIRALPPFLRQLRATSRTVSASTTDLDRATSTLLRATPRLQPALEQIVATAPDVRHLLADLPATLRAGKRGLPALKDTLRAAPPALRQLYPALREVIPALQILAENRAAVTPLFALPGQLVGNRAMPDGSVVPVASAMATVWNESVTGWVHKLPTNRYNPYFKPGALQTYAANRGGVLQSYDCRHLGNPLWLPATGGQGAMPCVVQGAWDFNGKSRYYPHPDLAPP